MVEVTDEDREAAATFNKFPTWEGSQRVPDRAARDTVELAEAFARHRIAAYQRGKIEGARLAIDATERAATEWFPYENDGVVQSIRALSPAKIVGEG